MVDVVFDSTIVIDYLNGVAAAKKEFSLYSERAISQMTWIEVMVGASGDLEASARNVLARFQIIALDQAISERAVAIRREHRIRLPDAIILATAQSFGATLVTRNTKDFRPGTPGIRIPYRI